MSDSDLAGGGVRETRRGSLVRWWAVLAAGTGASILIAWLARLAGVQLRTVQADGPRHRAPAPLPRPFDPELI